MDAPERRALDREPGLDLEVVVVGPGPQAGLAMGYALQRQGRRLLIVEARSVASAWRDRWDSLTLFTPRRFDSLPGLPFPGDPDGIRRGTRSSTTSTTTRDGLELPIEEQSPVRRRTSRDGRFRSTSTAGRHRRPGRRRHRPVPDPVRAGAAERLAPVVFQMHATGYRGRRLPPKGRCLSLAEATRASRSPRSSRRRTGSSSAWARASYRSRSGCWVATCSGG